MVNSDVFKDATIDEDEHDRELQHEARESKKTPMLKGVVPLEKLYDLKIFLRGPVNIKTHSSMMSH